jgi:hypothetical protein
MLRAPLLERERKSGAIQYTSAGNRLVARMAMIEATVVCAALLFIPSL